MGYDMTILNPRESYGDTGVEDPNYFGANIWSMRHLRAVMGQVGILDDEASYPPFPGVPDGYRDAVSVAEAAQENGEPVAILPKEYADYEVASRNALAFRGAPGKIPTAKFCSNDGWIVTPEECKLIYDGLKTFKPAEAPEGWDLVDFTEYVREFAQFANRASQASGFEVH